MVSLGLWLEKCWTAQLQASVLLSKELYVWFDVSVFTLWHHHNFARVFRTDLHRHEAKRREITLTSGLGLGYLICALLFQSKFSSFLHYQKNFNNDNFNYDSLKDGDFVYMRWKEHFLIPDHNIRDINGASFAGFYYICLQKSLGTIEGLYYHRSSELYQSLSLKHVAVCSYEVYQFR